MSFKMDSYESLQDFKVLDKCMLRTLCKSVPLIQKIWGKYSYFQLSKLKLSNLQIILKF